MELRSAQAPSAVVMIRPHHFSPNAETASDNAFQSDAAESDRGLIEASAYEQASRAAEALERAGIKVHIFDDTGTDTPDSVFPNNWFSTYPGGHVAVFPMYAPNRRTERRQDVLEMLKSEYRVQDIIDYSGLEPDGLFLEGTGAMVLDHLDRVAYAIKSNRTDPVVLERFCTHFNYEPMVFEACDRNGVAVYHTNVLMCIASEFVLIGSDMIADPARRDEIETRLQSSGKEIVALSNEQIANFAGNAIELQGRDGRVLALSRRAHQALTLSQIETIEKSAKLLDLDIPTIEMAGGSVRCMLAGIHLSPRG